jgi:trehalose 6-phosphate phosphatase
MSGAAARRGADEKTGGAAARRGADEKTGGAAARRGAVRPSEPSATAAPQPVRAAEALARAAGDLDKRPLLVVSDFDGTLSKIVQDPWAATILAPARRALRRLAGMPEVHVAILSGRTAADVVERARVGGARYLGNHGLESGELGRGRRAGSLVVESDPAHASFASRVDALADSVAQRVAEPWLIVERKGPAVAFHYRAAPDLAAAATRVADAVDAVDPGREFARLPGRRVLELRPPGAIAKGQATDRLLKEIRPGLAFVLGDDRSDAEAFAALRRARDAGETRGLALAVQAHAEAPPEVARSADLLLASPVEAARFLGALARDAAARESGAPARGRGPARRAS